MSDTNSPAGGGAGPSGSRRPLTIDLGAEDFGRAERPLDQPDGGPEERLDAADLRDEPIPSELADPSDEVGADPAEAADAGIAPEPPAFPAYAEPPVSRTEHRPPPPPPARRRGFGSLLLAALLGGIVSGGALLALERRGELDRFLGARPDPTAAVSQQVAALGSDVAALQARPASAPTDLAPVRSEIAALRQQVDEVANRPVPAAVTANPAGLEDVQKRLAALEQAKPNTAGPNTAGADAVQGLGSRLDQLAADVDALKKAPAPDAAPALAELRQQLADISGRLTKAEQRPAVDPAELTAAIARLQQRVEALASGQQAVTDLKAQLGQVSDRLDKVPTEARVAALETGLAQANRQADLAKTLGAGVAAGALADALASGAPFRPELDAMAKLGLDEAAIAPLRQQAETGLPTLLALRSEFDQETSGVDLRQAIPATAGPMDRLLQSARGLVEVRAAGAAQGGDPSAVIARIRAALDAGDLKAALAEWEALPESGKSATAHWRQAAQARLAAEALVARLRADALARLGTQG